MNFQWLIYALVFNSLLCAIGTGSISIPATAFGLAALPVGFWLDSRGTILVPVRWALPVFIVVMGLAIAEYMIGGIGWFFAVLDLLVMVTGVKLLSPKANRDYIQLMALALLLILASSILTTNASFSLHFLAYVLLTCWTLMVLTVKSVTENDPDPVKSPVATQQAHLPTEKAKRLLEGKLYGVAILVVAFVVVFTVVFFAAFPRLGAGIVGGTLGQSRSSGLSDTVDFSVMGELKPDHTVVLRLEVLQGDVELPIYLRGNTLDSYHQARWEATLQPLRLPPYERGNLVPVASEYGREVSYRVLADDLGVASIPLLPNTLWLQHKSTSLFSKGDATVQLSQRFRGAFGIDAVAYPDAYIRGELRPTTPLIPERVRTKMAPGHRSLKTYLKVPTEALDVVSQVKQYLRTPQDLASWSHEQKLEALDRLQGYMRRAFTYTLRQPIGPDPLLSFWQDQQGHCEYFATVFALFARSLGLPSRIVSGFSGGEPAPFGDYYLFRNSDAHSWVEVWHPDYGWLSYDPTPPYDDSVSWLALATQKARDAVDYYNYWWIQRVIAYDLANQADIINSFSLDFTQQGRSRESFKIDDTYKAVGAGVILVVTTLLVWLWLRPKTNQQAGDTLEYDTVPWRTRLKLRRIERRWGTRAHNQTWQEYLNQHIEVLPAAAISDITSHIARRYRNPQEQS